MDGYFECKDISEVIESALTTYDHLTSRSMSDNDAIHIIEKLFDTYYFNEIHVPEKNELLYNGYQYVIDAIKKGFPSVDLAELIKVIGAIYFVARRRNAGGRDYVSIIRKYVGIDIGDGLKVKIIDGSEFQELRPVSFNLGPSCQTFFSKCLRYVPRTSCFLSGCSLDINSYNAASSCIICLATSSLVIFY